MVSSYGLRDGAIRLFGGEKIFDPIHNHRNAGSFHNERNTWLFFDDAALIHAEQSLLRHHDS